MLCYVEIEDDFVFFTCTIVMLVSLDKQVVATIVIEGEQEEKKNEEIGNHSYVSSLRESEG